MMHEIELGCEPKSSQVIPRSVKDDFKLTEFWDEIDRIYGTWYKSEMEPFIGGWVAGICLRICGQPNQPSRTPGFQPQGRAESSPRAGLTLPEGGLTSPQGNLSPPAERAGLNIQISIVFR